MGENNRDWLHSLFRTATACVIGFSVVELLDRLLEQDDHEVQEVVDRFMKALQDTRKKKFNDSVEECISCIRKDFEAEIKKKQDDDQKVCSDSLEECLSDVRKVLEDSFEDRNRGTLNDEKLCSDVEECLTDIKKLLK